MGTRKNRMNPDELWNGLPVIVVQGPRSETNEEGAVNDRFDEHKMTSPWPTTEGLYGRVNGRATMFPWHSIVEVRKALFS